MTTVAQTGDVIRTTCTVSSSVPAQADVRAVPSTAKLVPRQAPRTKQEQICSRNQPHAILSVLQTL
eukprot:m.142435 g.142435  ORF g.142435 m.142435 type:complete len:66 (-) comp14067_c0_seq1:219-416(-)